MWTGTPVKANTLDRAGGGQTSAPDFCIFASPLVLLPVFCEEHIRANTPVKTNTPNGAGGGLLSAPDFCIFALSPALQSGDFLRRTHVGRPPAKRQTPRQRRRLLASLLWFPHRPAVPQTGRIFAGRVRQTAGSGGRRSLPPRWSITGQLPLWQRRGHSAETASVRRDFCIEKGQARKPVLF